MRTVSAPGFPRALAWILLLSAVVRICAVLPAHSGGYGSDEKEYIFLAHQILDGKGFVDSNGEYSIKAPLFPALLALSVWLSGSSLLLPFLLIALLGSVSVFVGYLLALDLWGDGRVAIFAAGLIAFAPPLVLYGALLMSENLFIALFLSTLLLARRLRTDQRISTLILFGIVAALATLTRAVFLGLVPILLVALALTHLHTGARPMRLLIALGVWCLVLAPWTVRNYTIHSTFVPVSTFGGRSLLLGNNPYSHGTTNLDSGFQEWLAARLKDRGVAGANSLNEVREIEHERSIALEFMADHPARTFTLALKKVFVFWIYPLSHQSGNHPLQAFLMGSDVLLYLAALGGTVLARIRGLRLFPLWSVLGFFTLVHAVLHAEARYRLPLLPIVCILAAGIFYATDPVSRRVVLTDRRSKIILSGCLLVLLFLYGIAGWVLLSGRA